MMMWTKNAVNPSQPDSSGGTVHQIRGPSFRAADGDVVSTVTADGAPATGTRVVHVHEGTPEQIAYKLFHHILEMEEVYVTRPAVKGNIAGHRQYILETYAQCIRAVRGEKFS